MSELITNRLGDAKSYQQDTSGGSIKPILRIAGYDAVLHDPIGFTVGSRANYVQVREFTIPPFSRVTNLAALIEAAVRGVWIHLTGKVPCSTQQSIASHSANDPDAFHCLSRLDCTKRRTPLSRVKKNGQIPAASRNDATPFFRLLFGCVPREPINLVAD